MFLKQLIEALVIPPGFFLVVLIAILALVALKKRRSALVVASAGCALLYLLSIEPISGMLLRPLEDRYRPYGESSLRASSVRQQSAVVVLGGGTIPVSPEENGAGSPSSDFLKRLVYGARLSRSLSLPLIISGGTSPDAIGAEPEAVVAERLLNELALSPPKLLLERESIDTWGNAEQVERKFHPGRIILVTSAYHMPRALYAFERHGMSVLPAPTDYKARRTPYRAVSFLPGAGNLAESSTAIKEYLGLLIYRLRK